VTIGREEAYRQVSGPPISDGRMRDGDGYAVYQFLRQHGEWPRAVSGWDPETESDRFRALMPLGNIGNDYPPTLLIHGDRDTDVPHDRSLLVDEELAERGVEHRLITAAGAEHGLADVKQEAVDEAIGEVGSFLRRHLRAMGDRR
jgi:dipeptidyl aminopeptidase/acylaminoacyl peptidase